MYHNILFFSILIISVLISSYLISTSTTNLFDTKNIKEKFIKYFYKETEDGLVLKKVEYANPEMRDILKLLITVETDFYILFFALVSIVLLVVLLAIGNMFISDESSVVCLSESQMMRIAGGCFMLF